MSDVFISHSSKDKEVADKIVSYLEERGLECWIAPRDIIPGMDWAASISTAISTSKVFLIIYSKNSSESSQVAREVSLAEAKKNVFVVPYKIDDTELTGTFEYFLTGSHWVTANHSKKNYNFEELYNNIINITGKNVQNITNNTYIDNLHLHGVDHIPADLGQQITTQTGAQGFSAINKPAAVEPEPGKKKKIIIIASVAAAVVVCAVVGIILAAGNSGSNNVTTESSQTNDIVSSAPTVQSSVPSVQSSVSSAPKNVTNELVDVVYFDWTVSCKYTGPVNSSGKPDGKGSISGEYSDSEDSFTLTYEGDFDNGVISGSGSSVKAEANGKTKSYSGEWKNSRWDGKGTEIVTFESGDFEKKIYSGTFSNGQIISGSETDYYIDGDVRVYDGEWADANWNGKGTVTLTYKTGDIEKTVWECNYKDGKKISGKQTDYYTNGNIETQQITG